MKRNMKKLVMLSVVLIVFLQNTDPFTISATEEPLIAEKESINIGVEKENSARLAKSNANAQYYITSDGVGEQTIDENATYFEFAKSIYFRQNVERDGYYLYHYTFQIEEVTGEILYQSNWVDCDQNIDTLNEIRITDYISPEMGKEYVVVITPCLHYDTLIWRERIEVHILYESVIAEIHTDTNVNPNTIAFVAKDNVGSIRPNAIITWEIQDNTKESLYSGQGDTVPQWILDALSPGQYKVLIEANDVSKYYQSSGTDSYAMAAKAEMLFKVQYGQVNIHHVFVDAQGKETEHIDTSYGKVGESITVTPWNIDKIPLKYALVKGPLDKNGNILQDTIVYDARQVKDIYYYYEQKIVNLPILETTVSRDSNTIKSGEKEKIQIKLTNVAGKYQGFRDVNMTITLPKELQYQSGTLKINDKAVTDVQWKKGKLSFYSPELLESDTIVIECMVLIETNADKSVSIEAQATMCCIDTGEVCTIRDTLHAKVLAKVEPPINPGVPLLPSVPEESVKQQKIVVTISDGSPFYGQYSDYLSAIGFYGRNYNGFNRNLGVQGMDNNEYRQTGRHKKVPMTGDAILDSSGIYISLGILFILTKKQRNS